MTDTGQLRSKRGLTMDVAADLGDLLMDLTHNKETRADIARLIKKAKPESPHAAAFKDVELEDRLSAFEQKQEQQRIDEERKATVTRLQGQRQRLLDGDGEGGRKYSEDDIKRIEDLMEERGLVSYEDAAVLYSHRTPQPGPYDDEPAPTPTWEFPDFERFKDDPVKASKETAYEVIRELRRKNGRR